MSNLGPLWTNQSPCTNKSKYNPSTVKFNIRQTQRANPFGKYTHISLQEDNFQQNLIFAFLLMTKSLNLNSAYYYNFMSLSMIAYMIKTKKIKNR